MSASATSLEAIRLALQAELPRLEARYSVRSLAVFGSFARGEAGPKSDVDLLVEFERPVGLFAFLGLKEELEALLQRPVDLVVREALKAQLREQILTEAVDAA